MTTTKYLSCAETAKLVRQALKKAFPGVKFSVRSDTYSGGASINVGWIDGPLEAQVKSVVSAFKGAEFDGTIDLKHCNKSWLLPDGSATWGKSEGTVGSMGVHEGYDHTKPHPDAMLVHFDADFIFTNREYSLPFFTRAVDAVARKNGLDASKIEIKTWKDDSYPYVSDHNLGRLMHQELAKRTNYLKGEQK